MCMIKEFGLQNYTIREHLTTREDVYEAMKTIKEMGYTIIQTAGEKIPLEELAEITKEVGITVCGTHCGLPTLINDPEKAMELHRLLGTTNIGVGGIAGFSEATEEEVKERIKQMNAFADIIYPYGFKFTYHNHEHEFRKLGDKTVMDMLVEGLDPVKTTFCLDTHWVQRGGGDVCAWIEKLAGRIDIIHLKDMVIRPDRTPTMCEIGYGNMDFHRIIAAAEKAGVQYYVVEQDECDGDSFDSIKKSADYIRANFVEC